MCVRVSVVAVVVINAVLTKVKQGLVKLYRTILTAVIFDVL